MIPGCAMDSSLSLLLISLIGVAAFVFGFALLAFLTTLGA
jgi:hypothetical protein